MENVQLWLLEEMSSANLSGARGLELSVRLSTSDLPLLPPPYTTPGIQEQEKGQRDSCITVSTLAWRGRGAEQRARIHLQSVIPACHRW